MLLVLSDFENMRSLRWWWWYRREGRKDRGDVLVRKEVEGGANMAGWNGIC